MIGLLAYGGGNVRSVQNAFAALNQMVRVVQSPADFDGISRLVLPGVGHFAALIEALDELHLRAPLTDFLASNRPFLGICLGMQALFEASEEAPGMRGLGVLQGLVEKLPESVRSPHMGWNSVRFSTGETQSFYFANSYAVRNSDQAWGVSEHGLPMVSAVRRGSITGVQFHPEKSGQAGLQLLQRWATDAR